MPPRPVLVRTHASSQHHLFLSALAALIMVGCGYVFFLHPLSAQVIATQKQALALRQAELKEHAQYLDKVSQIQLSFDKFYAQYHDAVARALPKDEALAELYALMGTMAQDNNLTMPKLGVNISEKKGGPVQVIHLTVALTGGYNDFKGYIADVESNLRLIDIQSIVYSPAKNSFMLELSSYFLPAQTSPSSTQGYTFLEDLVPSKFSKNPAFKQLKAHGPESIPIGTTGRQNPFVGE